MPFIPRQVKPPTRIAITCKLPQHLATLLKWYAEFLDSSQEYVVTETLALAFRKDRDFQAWLAATHPESVLAAATGSITSATPATAASTTSDPPVGNPSSTVSASTPPVTPSRSPATATQER